MEWLEIIEKLRIDLDHLEATLKAANYNDEVNMCVTRGFILNFTESLYPEGLTDER
jgi:hypothetical protein